MSADNWTECPQCRKGAERRLQQARTNLSKLYGKVTAEEYERARVKLGQDEDRQTEADHTLREDYTQGVDSDGYYEVGYSCACSVCGFSWSYNHKVKVV